MQSYSKYESVRVHIGYFLQHVVLNQLVAVEVPSFVLSGNLEHGSLSRPYAFEVLLVLLCVQTF